MAARRLVPQWDITLIAASIGISLLGAFTSTQLVCQAKLSPNIAGAAVWMTLGSLTFGFCSIWSLHEVAMLAYGLDLRIGIDVGLTILSAILAVFFTFVALATPILHERMSQRRRKKYSASKSRKLSTRNDIPRNHSSEGSSEPLLSAAPYLNGTVQTGSADVEAGELEDAEDLLNSRSIQRASVDPAQPSLPLQSGDEYGRDIIERSNMQHRDSFVSANSQGDESETAGDTESYQDTASRGTSSRRSSSFGNSSLGLGGVMGMKRYQFTSGGPANPFVAAYYTLRTGLTVGNVVKGFFWAIAITSMHYVGIRGLKVPNGYVSLNPFLVALSFIICWIVCLVGCVLILGIETHLGQQLLFSCVATCGVAAMHFTGMRAATFFSYDHPTEHRGYPPGLATAIAAVAISTCLAANLLLAHSATVSRNKLAEVVWTRRKLWMAIAQKETAESAAAARSEFIASASHEIRTPLHHLQGYSDLLSRTELTEEGRLLLCAIQRATKTLSLITNNVLDWSRLEKDGEASSRPVSLDVRTICESIMTLLPNQDDEADVEVMVAVAPNVPSSLFIDETYIHRILMNLLSNALKFTVSGYILLSIGIKDDQLVASVTDTGCGIPPDFLPQLFEPFKQAQVRGKARGTGLGLSIIRQLLQKVGGTIEVQSKWQEDANVGPARSGSKFTITMPIQQSEAERHLTNEHGVTSIAIFHGGNIRALEGLKAAWEEFGLEVFIAARFSDLSGLDVHYIWADLSALQMSSGELLEQLLNENSRPVIVPYDTQSNLSQVVGLNPMLPIVPIQTPLLLHSIKKAVDLAALRPNKSNLPRAVRFDPVVTDIEETPPQAADSTAPEGLPRQQSFAEVKSVVETVVREPSQKKDRMILLVEDNPINCKLGKKMLQSLGYKVIIAEDGEQAIATITAHDDEIDAILMDQSMPRKDGLTATKEIRALERDGQLGKAGRPIIAVSAVVSEEAQTLFRLAGADDFLAKPLSLGKLETTLALHLNAENSTP